MVKILTGKNTSFPVFSLFLAWKDQLRNKETMRADLMAGLLGAIMVLPQGVAFALIAGLPPIYGLYSAMVSPIISGLMGSSRHMVSGPTTAISLIIATTVSQYAVAGSAQYIEMTLVLTFLVGAIQLGMGIGRLGRYVGFVSHTVVVGFTAGASFLIITSQVKNMLGIEVANRASFLETWREIFQGLGQTKPLLLAVSAATIVAAIVAKKISKRIPDLIVGLAVGTLVAWLLGGESAGIQSVGHMPAHLPPFDVPSLTPENFHLLIQKAFVVALLSLVQSIAIARSIAIKSGDMLDGNQEFIGQGLSNMVGSFFSCYASSGSFSRSALNYEAGAKTPMSAVFSAGILMLIILFLAPYAALLPMPAMAGLIVMVGWNLIDSHHMEEIQLASREDNIILGVVFFTTLFAELEFAIYIGVLLSLYFYLKRTSRPNIAVMAPDPEHNRHQIINVQRKQVPQCPQVKIIRIDGNLFFGAIPHVAGIFREYRKGNARYLMLLINGVNHVDLDGAEWLQNEAKYWKEKKEVALCWSI